MSQLLVYLPGGVGVWVADGDGVGVGLGLLHGVLLARGSSDVFIT